MCQAKEGVIHPGPPPKIIINSIKKYLKRNIKAILY